MICYLFNHILRQGFKRHPTCEFKVWWKLPIRNRNVFSTWWYKSYNTLFAKAIRFYSIFPFWRGLLTSSPQFIYVIYMKQTNNIQKYLLYTWSRQACMGHSGVPLRFRIGRHSVWICLLWLSSWPLWRQKKLTVTTLITWQEWVEIIHFVQFSMIITNKQTNRNKPPNLVVQLKCGSCVGWEFPSGFFWKLLHHG